MPISSELQQQLKKTIVGAAYQNELINLLNSLTVITNVNADSTVDVVVKKPGKLLASSSPVFSISDDGTGQTGNVIHCENQRLTYSDFGYSPGVTASDWEVSAGWGTTAVLTVVPGSNNVCGRVHVHAQGEGEHGGVSARPTLTLNFSPTGFWKSAPFPVVCRGTGDDDMNLPVSADADADELTIRLEGTPTAGGVYIFNYFLLAGTDSSLVAANPLPNNSPRSNGAGNCPLITSQATATFTVGQAGLFTVVANGASSTFGLTNTAPFLPFNRLLPTGVTFTDNGDGTATISGTPAADNHGVYQLNLIVSNGISTPYVQPFTLTVYPSDGSSIITSPLFAVANNRLPFSFTVRTSGTPVGSLNLTNPNGYVVFNAGFDKKTSSSLDFVDNGDGTGTISGTPNGVPGDLTVSITAFYRSTASDTKTFALRLNSQRSINITSAPGAVFVAGKRGSFTVRSVQTVGVIADNPFNLSQTFVVNANALPTGLNFTDNGDGTGTIAGTPDIGAAGRTYGVNIGAAIGTGSTGQTYQYFSLKVVAP